MIDDHHHLSNDKGFPAIVKSVKLDFGIWAARRFNQPYRD